MPSDPVVTQWRPAVKVLVHQLIEAAAKERMGAPALVYKKDTVSYEALWDRVATKSREFLGLGIGPGDRIGIYLEKRIETVVSMFAAAAAGAVFVPINPLLRPHQVSYILRDCNVRILVTSQDRLDALTPELIGCEDLRWVVAVGESPLQIGRAHV